MAGTRLLVHAVFLGEFLLLVAAAAFCLCYWTCGGDDGDLVCRPLHRQTGRSILQQQEMPTILLNNNKEENNLTFPPVRLTCADSQVVFWQSALLSGRIRLPGDEVVFTRFDEEAAAHLKTVCQDPTSSANDVVELSSLSDLWICETTTPSPNEARMVVHNSSTIFYPRGGEEGIKDMERLYPSKRTRIRFKLTVFVGRYRTDWKEWVEAINRWLDEQRLVDWPCLVEPPQLQVKFRDISDISEPTKMNSNKTVYQIPTEDISSSFYSSSDDGSLRVSVFLPSKLPAVFVDGTGQVSNSVLLRGNDILTVVADEAESKESYQNIIHGALNGSVIGHFMSECMGLPPDLTEIVILEQSDDDGSFPQWYSKLWYQRVLRDTYTEAVSMAIQERQFMLGTPRTVLITEEIAQQWQKSVEMIESAQDMARRGLFPEALQELDASIDMLKSLRANSALLEPLDFPLDQYAAIFSPLLLPLLLPLLSGLVREIKRYRKLTKKKIE